MNAYELGVKLAMAEAFLTKEASTRIFRELSKLAPAAREAAINKLPKELRHVMSYKFLGREAANTASRVSDVGGHGAQHIFGVTRDAQKLTKGMPREIRERATLGSLLHDVGREAEGELKKRLGKQRFQETPSVWHSELGGRYTKQFLQRNKQYAKNVPGLDRGRLSGAVRAHDTDAWDRMPWLRRRVGIDAGPGSDRAATATYLADKAQGLGRTGAERTVAMAKKFKETPEQTWGVVQKNVDKYRTAIDRLATPAQQNVLNPQLQRYQDAMGHYRTTGRLPALQQQKAASVKEGMSLNDVTRILGLVGKENPQTLVRMLRNLIQRDPSSFSHLLSAAYSFSGKQAGEIIEFLGKHMADIR